MRHSVGAEGCGVCASSSALAVPDGFEAIGGHLSFEGFCNVEARDMTPETGTLAEAGVDVYRSPMARWSPRPS